MRSVRGHYGPEGNRSGLEVNALLNSGCGGFADATGVHFLSRAEADEEETRGKRLIVARNSINKRNLSNIGGEILL